MTVALWTAAYLAVSVPAAVLLGRFLRESSRQPFDFDQFCATVLSTPLPDEEPS